MSPEARKRTETGAERYMREQLEDPEFREACDEARHRIHMDNLIAHDPIGVLRHLPDWLAGHGALRMVEGDPIARVIEDLRQIADQVVPRPPTVSEIIAHLDAGGEVESYNFTTGVWMWSGVGLASLAKCLDGDDRPIYGFRLAPTPKPTTERVPLHRVPGRTLPGQEDEVTDIHVEREDRDGVVTAWGRLLAVGHREVRIPVADDGTVEVLVENDR